MQWTLVHMKVYRHISPAIIAVSCSNLSFSPRPSADKKSTANLLHVEARAPQIGHELLAPCLQLGSPVTGCVQYSWSVWCVSPWCLLVHEQEVDLPDPVPEEYGVVGDGSGLRVGGRALPHDKALVRVLVILDTKTLAWHASTVPNALTC